MGLLLAQAIAELNDGNILLGCRDGTGTEMILQLPLSSTSAAPPASGTAPTEEGGNKDAVNY